MKDIAIYGSGGLGREIACLIKLINKEAPKWNIIGFFDDVLPIGTSNEFGEILGGINELNSWKNKCSVVVAIGTPSTVKNIINKIKNTNLSFPNIIAPDTIYLDEKSLSIGVGNIICCRCLISCDVSIGDFNLFNGYIPVGHDTVIGSFNSIMPSTNISGRVKIGNENFIGVQSAILQGVKIGNNVRIGANSVVMHNTKDGNLYIGNPALKVKF